ncbi:hypothetical protein COOONC_16757 [Cooperia oncophora]
MSVHATQEEWYKEMLRLLDAFWEVWYSDYLSALRERQQLRIRQAQVLCNNTAATATSVARSRRCERSRLHCILA